MFNNISVYPSDILGLGISSKKETKRDTRRSFTQTQKNEILYQQDNKCALCHGKLDPRDKEFDHKKAWAAKGRTKTQNGRAVCGSCHNKITHKQRLKKVDTKRKTKSNNVNSGLPLINLPEIKMQKLF